MAYENLQYGMAVEVRGKRGVIREVSDKIKVKFEDGSFEFVESSAITPYVADTRLKGMKEGLIMMEPTATGTDPLSQPKRKTGRGVGEPQNVLGKEATQDRLLA